MNRTSIGVLGLGYWGKKIVTEYALLGKKRDDFSLYAAVDLDQENLRFCRDSLDIPVLTTNYKEVICDPSVSAVNICTPNETHFEVARYALEEGKHLLIEKPMTLSAEQARELISLAHSKRLVLCVGHIYRFNNALFQIKKLISQGLLGQILHLKLQWTTFSPPLPNRDIVTDLAPHPLDILNYLLDSWPKRLTCFAKAFRREDLEELAYIVAEFSDRKIAHIEISWLLPGKKRELTIVGSEKSALVDCLRQRIFITENNDSNNELQGCLNNEIKVVPNNTIESELSHFIDCINTGNPPVNGSHEGLKVVEMLELLRKSLVEKRTVESD